MSSHLHQFLIDAFERLGQQSQKNLRARSPIQIDDQDDNDILTEFCTIFISVGKRGRMELELAGAIPITLEISDLAEIYNGYVELSIPARVVLYLTPAQIDVLTDLATKLRRTADLGSTVGNPGWSKVCSRTISSLHRFVRIIKEYERLEGISKS
jgi:hypothetical protein